MGRLFMNVALGERSIDVLGGVPVPVSRAL